MTNSLRLALGILLATVYQFFVEALWYVALFPNLATHDLGPIQRAYPLLLFNFISELGLSLLVAYVLAQSSGRLPWRKVLLAGVIVGALTGLNQYADWYGSFNIAALVLLNFWIKDILLALGSALIIHALWGASQRKLA